MEKTLLQTIAENLPETLTTNENINRRCAEHVSRHVTHKAQKAILDDIHAQLEEAGWVIEMMCYAEKETETEKLCEWVIDARRDVFGKTAPNGSDLLNAYEMWRNHLLYYGFTVKRWTTYSMPPKNLLSSVQ